MKISIKYMGSIINLPLGITEHLRDAGEAELKVILGISAFSNYFNDFDSAIPLLCEKLELDLCEVTKSLEYWAAAGILEIDGVSLSANTVSTVASKKNEAPSYTGEQVRRLVDSNPDFKNLADCAQGVLEKDFTPNDYNSLLQLKTYYKFSDEYILMLLAYCQENDTASWAYIRKVSKSLYDEGVDTYEKLEEHFKARRNKRSLEYKVRKLFGVGMREFTKKERTYFDTWVELKYSYELIKLAYEISVDNGKGANWSYTAKILENWHVSGVKTVEDAENTIAKNKDRLNASSFDTDDFFEAALKRSDKMFKEGSKK